MLRFTLRNLLHLKHYLTRRKRALAYFLTNLEEICVGHQVEQSLVVFTMHSKTQISKICPCCLHIYLKYNTH